MKRYVPVDPLPEEAPSSATPGWLITYADLVTLLLACFIMLVGMSELKAPARYQTMLNTMRRQFGAEGGWLSSRASPRTALARIAWKARTRRQELLGLDDPAAAQPSIRLAIDAAQTALTPSQQRALDRFNDEAIPSQDPVDVVAYAVTDAAAPSPGSTRAALDGAHKRAGQVVEGLVSRGIASHRIRVQALLSSPPSLPDQPPPGAGSKPTPPAVAAGAVEVRLLSGP